MPVVESSRAVSTPAVHGSKPWEPVMLGVAEAFRMGPEETGRFTEKEIARLIAAIPFLAGCEDPERTAASHLAAYVLSVKMKHIANCVPGDDADVFRRLEMINNFIGGDSRIIRKGMSMIAFNMIMDYRRDIGEDLRLGKHNPIESGAWDFNELCERLKDDVESVDCPEMEEVMGLFSLRMEWWMYS